MDLKKEEKYAVVYEYESEIDFNKAALICIL